LLAGFAADFTGCCFGEVEPMAARTARRAAFTIGVRASKISAIVFGFFRRTMGEFLKCV